MRLLLQTSAHCEVCSLPVPSPFLATPRESRVEQAFNFPFSVSQRHKCLGNFKQDFKLVLGKGKLEINREVGRMGAKLQGCQMMTAERCTKETHPEVLQEARLPVDRCWEALGKGFPGALDPSPFSWAVVKGEGRKPLVTPEGFEFICSQTATYHWTLTSGGVCCLRASYSQCEKRPQEQHLFPSWDCSRWPGALMVTSNMCWDKTMRLRAECHFSSWCSLAGWFQGPEVYRSSNLLQKADFSWL